MSRHPFREAVERADLDAAVALLAEDVVFRSPAVFKPYEGREAVATILRAVFDVFEDFHYTDELDGDDVHGRRCKPPAFTDFLAVDAAALVHRRSVRAVQRRDGPACSAI
jgi:hypothetical protein